MENNMKNVTDNIIEVRDAYMSYGSDYSRFSNKRTVVFKGLNMTVERGSIYALLGPSGCGKTTILKCIIGRSRIDAGEIILKVKDTSRIGYMPQDIGLVLGISIKETLNYYGWIYDIRGDKLEEKKKELFSILDIPNENSIVQNLSGGQKRRVSLCIALLRNPELLILDEPTVGIDPILSHNIWQFLLKLSSVEKKTIILTTHYIEEARQSDKVGMMRGGVLVIEGQAESLLDRYDCSSLEDVFVKLSHIQESQRSITDAEVLENYPKPSMKPKLTINDNRLFSFHCFMGFFMKNLYILKYGTFGWYLLFFIPITTCVMFQYSLGRTPRGLKVGVINEELSMRHGNCDNFSNLTCFPASCVFMSILKKNDIIPVPYNETTIASGKVNGNEIRGILHFSENFTESLQERLYKNMNTPDDSVDQSEVEVWIEPTNKIIADLLKYKIYITFFDYLEQLSQTCLWPVNHAMLPIQFKEPIYGHNTTEFSEFSVPGIFLILAYFLPVGYVLPLLEDKRTGIVERSLISGLTNLEILAAYTAVTMLLFLVQTFCIVTILYVIYGHVFEGSVILAYSLVTLVGFNGLCLGILVGVICDSIVTATFILLGILITDCCISGMFWSPEGMHFILKKFRWFFPMSLATEAYRSIACRAWTITHPVVYTGFISILVWIMAFCLAIYVIVKLKRGRGH